MNLNVPTILGIILVVVGLILLVVQIRIQGFSRQMRGGSAGLKGISLRTSYPGLILIVVGCAMVWLGK